MCVLSRGLANLLARISSCIEEIPFLKTKSSIYRLIDGVALENVVSARALGLILCNRRSQPHLLYKKLNPPPSHPLKEVVNHSNSRPIRVLPLCYPDQKPSLNQLSLLKRIIFEQVGA
jgi:hypothetical protein